MKSHSLSVPGALVCAGLALTLLTVSLPPKVRAYSSPDAFASAPLSGGGGGRFFTGSPAEGYDCAVCHAETPEQEHFPLYVAGLPLEGYELALRQEVVLSWPEFAAAWKAQRVAAEADSSVQPPALGLTAEFVAESGRASGILEIDAKNATAPEQCETRPGLKPKLAAQLYQVRPGLEPLRIKEDSTGLLRCEAHQLGQRCVVAMSSCGAEQVRVRWTSPSTREGSIWFAAGLVATPSISGNFDADSVHTVALPLLQRDSSEEKYQRVLRNGCALGAHRAGSTAAVWTLSGLAIAAALRRRSARRREST